MKLLKVNMNDVNIELHYHGGKPGKWEFEFIINKTVYIYRTPEKSIYDDAWELSRTSKFKALNFLKQHAVLVKKIELK